MTARASVIRREVAGVALSLLALFLLATFTGPWHAGTTGDVCAPAGGFTGPAGACARGALVMLLGVPATLLLPVAMVLTALRLFGRVSRSSGRAWMPFLGGMVVLLPVVFAVAMPTPLGDSSLVGGLWGAIVGHYLRAAVGPVGAWIFVLLAFSVLTVTTLAWNPIRILVGSDGGTGPGGDDGGEQERRPKRRRGEEPAAAATPAAVLMEPAPEEMPAIDQSLMNPTTVDEEPLAARERKRDRKGGSRDAATERAEAVAAELEATESAPHEHDELPPTSLLTSMPTGGSELDRSKIEAMGVKLKAALATFRVEAEIIGRTTGPVVTQFEVAPAPGVKVRQIANLSNDLALAMMAQSIRIVAPIPGRGAVGVEVPNPNPEVVGFRELLESREFQTARTALPIALGKNLEGKPVIADLAKMPHLLIAGATGSGKSVCVNTLITSLVYRHTPETLRLLMVDPKMVELSVYNALPHLRHKVITDNRDASLVLKWAVVEMQRRYELLAANSCRNIQDFNRRVQSGTPLMHPRNPQLAFEALDYGDGLLPYIVIVIDELADLMMTVQGEVETPLAMLAQKARAIGIHLILATQRPSVNVITGLIKANFPSRIAFRVASQVDSRTIIDGVGAESLLGNGDMLFIPPGKSEPERLQGAFIPSEDTERLTGWYQDARKRRQDEFEAQGLLSEEPLAAEPDILEEIRSREREETGAGAGDELEPGERDKLFREAAEIVVQHQQGSTSLLQRRLKVGYGRAARIIDQLHEAGVLGPPDGSRPRDVLVGLEEVARLCGKGDR
jgi:DNA segregation ATPase FtsK/SpoIIIE, S-DNA-T family